MKKIYIILFTVFLNLALFSCSTQPLEEPVKAEQACCGNNGGDPPPPPPPPNGND